MRDEGRRRVALYWDIKSADEFPFFATTCTSGSQMKELNMVMDMAEDVWGRLYSAFITTCCVIELLVVRDTVGKAQSLSNAQLLLPSTTEVQ